MSNSQQQNPFELSLEEFIDFLMIHGYTGEMGMFGEEAGKDSIIVLTKADSRVTIPYVKGNLKKEQVIASLVKTSLSFSQLEEYMKHLQTMKEVNKLIETTKSSNC